MHHFTYTSRSMRVLHEVEDDAQRAVAARVKAAAPEGIEVRVTHDDELGGWWLEAERDLSPTPAAPVEVTAWTSIFVPDRASEAEQVEAARRVVRAIERA